MKKDEIISVLSELHKISGLRVSLHGTDFAEIAAYPAEKLPFCSAIQKSEGEYRKCLACDAEACKKVLKSGKPYVYSCRYGLFEAIAPLYNFGTLTGYLMAGQVGNEKTDMRMIEAAVCAVNGNRIQAKKIADTLTVITEDMLESYIKIMTICAEYMTLINALPSRTPKLPELAKIYLHENFGDRITIKDICKSLGCSKSALLTVFKSEYGTTINNYLADIRIEEAKKLLLNSASSIGIIADKCGFYDQSYFSKVFLAKTGTTPSDYRKDGAK